MKFPFEATTRAGTKVTITGYYTGYDRPWCGFYDTELEDTKLLKITVDWNTDGSFSRDPEKQTSLDLIDLPVSQQT